MLECIGNTNNDKPKFMISGIQVRTNIYFTKPFDCLALQFWCIQGKFEFDVSYSWKYEGNKVEHIAPDHSVQVERL